MAEYLSPGVYVEEIDSGMKPMEGVSTSTAGFVGMTQRGKLRGTPEFIGSYMEFQNKFGGYLPKAAYGERRYLPMAVEQFFANGGSRCFVVRILDDSQGATAAEIKIGDVKITAANVGVWGNLVKISCKPDAMNDKLCNLAVSCMESLSSTRVTYEETYTEVSLDPNDDGYLVRLLEKSQLVRATYTPSGEELTGLYEAFLQKEEENKKKDTPAKGDENKEATPEQAGEKKEDTPEQGDEKKPDTPAPESGKKEKKWASVMLADGRDCTDGEPSKKIGASILKGTDGGPGKRTGLCALQDIPEISIVAAPGVTKPDEVQEIVTHCESMGNRVCILDMTAGSNDVTELQGYRAKVNSSFAAMYHPWLQVYDTLEKRAGYLPPSGTMAGIYARVDNTRGVHKAPANETIRSCTGLETLFGKAEQDMLNPVGVNLIRNIQGQGIRVWGARTCASDSAWKYINVRRLFIFLEESIRRSTGWAVFEPNDQLLWTKVYNSITSFLSTQWRNGALAGASEAEAYFVNVGLGSSMTQDDVLNGRMICQIGVAPSRPAEFVIFRISQIMENNS